MTVKSGASWSGTFVTVSGTGALTAATGTPTGVLYVDGTANGASVTVTGANPYKWTVTLPTLTAGQRVDMYIAATVSAISTGGIVASEQADTAYGSEALRPTVAGRTLDVSAGGEAGLDWANVGSPTTTVGLSGTTVKAVTDGVSLADDAITSAKFDESSAFPLSAADAGITYIMRTGADGDTAETLSDQLDATATAAALATVDGIVDDILVDTGTTLPATLATLATAAALATVDGIVDDILVDTGTTLPAAVAAVDSDVWTYATRTLTSTAAETTAALSGSTLNITARATYQATLSGLTISASWSKIWLTIKSDVGDADASSVVQIVESNPGAVTDGLLYLNGAAGTAAQGSLTVNQGAGTIDIVIADEATDDLTPAQGLIYDIKQLVAGVTTVLTDGAANIAYTATAAIA